MPGNPFQLHWMPWSAAINHQLSVGSRHATRAVKEGVISSVELLLATLAASGVTTCAAVVVAAVVLFEWWRHWLRDKMDVSYRWLLLTL